MTLDRLRQLAVPLVVVALVTCCGPSNGVGPKIDRSASPLAKQSYLWSAVPGTDLTIGPAVPVRAYIESRLDAQTMGSLDYAYPGFDRAVAKKAQEGHDLLTSNLRPDEDRGPVDHFSVGDNKFHIQSVSTSEGAVTATLCNYRYGLALENANATFSSVATGFVNDDGIDAMRLFLTAPSDGSENSPTPQRGSAATPADDVFGDWRITGFLNEFGRSEPEFARVWPTYDADLAKCVADAPDPPDRRAFFASGQHPRGDFPTSPPKPGWPEPSE